MDYTWLGYNYYSIPNIPFHHSGHSQHRLSFKTARLSLTIAGAIQRSDALAALAALASESKS